ncbi:DUF3598 domain-containing protein [Sandaracinobacter sp. RS1-74]|uniref:DUF3598 domain-containing protein n=1 Tax=Sandaracinobacteroides sayramensis TaxID=2913411 RepID=UPI001EDBB55D|nr:DUF3598 domain-containing protein [Sandaracinobacteroides sayramensis]MCG2841640.1 DUF3598 domain-containing protein [Sandaracinobacteroides sayramensis]
MKGRKMGLKEEMALLARHEGVWEGVYRHYGADGKLADEHRSRVICRFPEEGGFPYHQTNIFSWADGRSEVQEIPAVYKDGKIWWDTGAVKGWATELVLDENHRSLVLYWQAAADPELYLYEMVQISDCGKKRVRTWHWIRGGDLQSRTAIEEKLVSRDWQAADAKLKRAA